MVLNVTDPLIQMVCFSVDQPGFLRFFATDPRRIVSVRGSG
jgi:hypothetical protein